MMLAGRQQQLRQLLFSPPPAAAAERLLVVTGDGGAAGGAREAVTTTTTRLAIMANNKTSSTSLQLMHSFVVIPARQEQGCPAKRTVQRNDDDAARPAEYTVVYMGDHTCTPNDDYSLEAPPVILETTAVPAASTTSAAGQSPAISDDMTCGSSSDYADDYYGPLRFAVNDDSWAQETMMEDLISGPIRSPLHIPASADDAWTIDHYFLMLDAAGS
ncbi:hypothetical protein HU200_030644 [Digitaria exilis]|uniref:WRKY domain-containing protein n=1 Tax=Digitaria exilis TaxID=1010633 RepID=A0A835C2L3_9POAL|nr:hypothetical protein HU200_030644 [Digitaria exilis]